MKSDFAKVLHYLISKNTQGCASLVTFWKMIRDVNPNIGIITTNYDTLIDDSFDTIYPDCLIDYCVDLVNYNDPEMVPTGNWWIDPKRPIKDFSDRKSTRVKLVKVHGSLNWRYCNCCGQVTLTPWRHQIDLKKDSYESFIDTYISECMFDGNRLSSLIELPSHVKTKGNYIFSRLYDEASFMVRNAKRLVFVGYSFPEADVHIRALVRRCFPEDGEIIVINKSRAKELTHRYQGLANNVTYYDMPFERFVNSQRLKTLLEAN